MRITLPNPLLLRQWNLLFAANIYRLIVIVTLYILFKSPLHEQMNIMLYFFSLSLYLLFGLFCFFCCANRLFKFESQVLWFCTIDIVVMVLFINFLGHLESGLGILLFVTIAVSSILIPGRIAIYFASIASLMLLATNLAHYEYGAQNDLSPFFTTGIYGAGFFATAIVTCYLASRVRVSELMADQWANELISVLRVGEYFVNQFKSGVVYVESDGNVRLINNAVRQYFHLKQCHMPCALKQLLPALFKPYLAFIAMPKKKKKYAQTILKEYNLRVDFFSVSIASQMSVLMILEDLAVIEQQAQQFKLASLGQFSASIAHELRNPLGVISHAVQLMGEEKQLDGENLRLQALIVSNCHRMNQVIKNVLQLTKQQSAIPESIKLADFLKAFKDEFCLINRCDITIQVPESKKKTVRFDKSQLSQILVNLCDNAMQHGVDTNGEVHITLSIQHTAQGIALHVIDTGPGVPRTQRDLVFEPFFTTFITGNGMGLYIAKDLCEMNGARLVLAKAKYGCCFSILFNQHNEF